MFDNFNVNLRENEGFLTYIPCIPIPEYGQSNAPEKKSRGNFVKKASRLSRCVKGTLRNMPNVVGNFVACTDGVYGGLKSYDPQSPTRKRGLTFKCFVTIVNGCESWTKILIRLIGVYLTRNSNRTGHVTRLT